MTDGANRKPLGRIADFCDGTALALLALAALVSPTQWSLEPVRGLHVAPSDPLLLLAAGTWGMARLLQREWRRLFVIPWPAAAFLAWMLLSCITALDRPGAAKEWIQSFAYFGVGLTLFLDALAHRGPLAVRAAFGILLGTGAVVVLLAFLQYAGTTDAMLAPGLLYFRDYAPYLPDGALEPTDWLGHLSVRGTFGNRNVLGGFLALVLPFAFALALEGKGLSCRLAGLALAVAGCLVNLSGASMAALLAVFVLQAAAKSRAAAVATLLGSVALLFLVLPNLPRENTWELMRSIAPFDADSGEPARRYADWQAASEMVADRPWLGVGPGGYQRNIGPYYGTVPRATGPSEPDIQNLYLVLATTSGVPAAGFFLLLLACGAHRALGQRRAARRACAGVALAIPCADFRCRSALRLGAAGALAAYAVAAVWSPLLVRGIGLPLALVLALATMPPVEPRRR
ncbi:MAG: O-antigen ligase family protein [Kiritimatiellia bacterium]|jgi:O-antigen ligase